MNASRFPPISYAGRASAVRERLAEHDATALVVTDQPSVRWLTGFAGSNGSVALLPDRLVLVTDGRYRDRAADELAEAGVDAEIVVGPNRVEQRKAFVASFDGLDAVAADPAALTHDEWLQLADELPLRPVRGLIDDGRRVKDEGEVARIAEACRCADAALAEVAPTLGDGVTEADVRMELEYRMRRHGADGPSYDTIVASGPEHAARPHHETGPRRIREGDTVVIDVGALVDGYHSDMTRSYVVGEPSAEQSELYELLLGIQAAGIDAVASGVPAREVDATCRSLAAIAGYADWYLHSTGHGVGLMIHEDPFESPVATTELRTGDVVTVEPGLYRVGFGGFRIEDLVEVVDGGCRVLTASPKDTPCPPSPPTT
ncbi:MAG: Xaa-Pro peptidase family protein [Ilumatobacter sp.]|uniref:M24 family metallopeptidase n=1 Tax=Ilumatobacter sp. TaxID=1967498 RepID=UPI00261C1A3E|nr:Xaa-Pro peptidase family protein [Ilumatobacter sp.]MDJ0769896.1 Xaa-Pro peptidase family protein [Ilumatobacter sp.]